MNKNMDLVLKKFPIQCYQCGHKTGEGRLDGNCSKCGFSNEESLVQWIFEREKIIE